MHVYRGLLLIVAFVLVPFAFFLRPGEARVQKVASSAVPTSKVTRTFEGVELDRLDSAPVCN